MREGIRAIKVNSHEPVARNLRSCARKKILDQMACLVDWAHGLSGIIR